MKPKRINTRFGGLKVPGRRGQIFIWDVVLASILFVVIITLVVYLWTTVLQGIEATETEHDITWMATAVSEQLVRTPGVPYNWSDYPQLNNITVIGLADVQRAENYTRTMDRVLDLDKVLYFINHTENSYPTVRNKLLASGKYDFYVELGCADRNDSTCFDGLPLETLSGSGNLSCGNNYTFYFEDNVVSTSQGLIGYWRFDEGDGYMVGDSSLQKNNGSIPVTFIDNFTDGESWDEIQLTGTTWDDTYLAKITAGDPHFFKNVADFDESFDHLSLRYKSDSGGGSTAIGLYYTDNADCPGYSETCVQHSMRVFSDGFWRTLETKITDAQWVDNDGTIDDIRFDFENFAVQDVVYVDDIMFRKGPDWTTGKYAGGLVFDGKDDYVEVMDPDGVYIPSRLSVSAWIKINSTYVWQCIVEHGSPTEVGWHFYVNSGDHLYTNLGGEGYHSTSGTLTPGQWYHVAFVWDGSSVTHYVNGTSVGSKNLTSIYSVGDRVYLGIRKGGGAHQYGLNGTMDQVKIWDRVLTPDEMREEYEHARKVCRFGSNISMSDVDYQFYDEKTVTFTIPDLTVLNHSTALDPTAKLKIIVYKESP